MRSRTVGFLLFLCCGILVTSGCGGSTADSGGKASGLSSEKVTVSGQTAYELAVPPGLEKGRSYPVFFFLSPGGDPKDFLSVAGPACQELECIFAGSYNYRNDTHPDTWARPIKDCLDHLIRTQPVDKTRIFLAGFSGGAQASYVTSFFHPGICRGILANSGVVHQNLRDPAELRKCGLKAVALLSGTTDGVVTPAHLQKDEKLMGATGIPTLLVSFPGGHQLAPAALYRQAMEWLLKQ